MGPTIHLADNMADEEKSALIKVTVKTPKEKQEIEINADAGVKEFRELISKTFGAPVEQICLIFAGKILKDDESLKQHSIKDGLTVHLVVKASNRSQDQSAPPPSTASTGPTPAPQAD